MKMKVLFVVVLFALSGPVLAKAYRWIDGNGDIHYDEAPPADARDVQEIMVDMPPPPLPEKDSTTEPGPPVAGKAIAEQAADTAEAKNTTNDKVDPEVQKKCEAAVSLFPEFRQELEAKLKQKLKDGKITQESYDSFIGFKPDAKQNLSTTECEADYANVPESKTLIDCLAGAEAKASQAVNCMIMARIDDLIKMDEDKTKQESAPH